MDTIGTFLVVGLIISLFSFGIGYIVIKAAVKQGIIEAYQEARYDAKMYFLKPLSQKDIDKMNAKDSDEK